MAEYTKIKTARTIICDFCNQLYSDDPCKPTDCDWLRMLEEDAADVAPVRHGKWISWEEADNFIPSPHRHECSVCHDAAQALVNGVELLSDYCPNCGARMDGAE